MTFDPDTVLASLAGIAALLVVVGLVVGTGADDDE